MDGKEKEPNVRASLKSTRSSVQLHTKKEAGRQLSPREVTAIQNELERLAAKDARLNSRSEELKRKEKDIDAKESLLKRWSDELESHEYDLAERRDTVEKREEEFNELSAMVELLSSKVEQFEKSADGKMSETPEDSCPSDREQELEQKLTETRELLIKRDDEIRELNVAVEEALTAIEARPSSDKGIDDMRAEYETKLREKDEQLKQLADQTEAVLEETLGNLEKEKAKNVELSSQIDSLRSEPATPAGGVDQESALLLESMRSEMATLRGQLTENAGIMESLRNEAAQAKEMRVLFDEMETKLTEATSRYQEACRTMADRIEDSERHAEEMAAAKEAVEADLVLKEQEAKSLEDGLAVATAEIDNLKKGLDARDQTGESGASGEVEHLEKKCESLQNDLTRATDQYIMVCKNMQDKISELEADKEKLSTQLASSIASTPPVDADQSASPGIDTAEAHEERKILAEEERDKAREEVESLKEELESLRFQLCEASQNLETLKEELAAKDESLVQHINATENAAAECGGDREAIGDEAKQNWEVEKEALEQARTTLETRLSALEAHCGDLENMMKSKDDEIKEMRENVAQNEGLVRTATESMEANKELKQRVDQLESLVAEHESRTTAGSGDAGDHERDEGLESKVESLEISLKARSEMIEELESACETLQSENRALQCELQETRTQAKEKVAALNGTVSDMKQLIAARDEHISSVLNPRLAAMKNDLKERDALETQLHTHRSVLNDIVMELSELNTLGSPRDEAVSLDTGDKESLDHILLQVRRLKELAVERPHTEPGRGLEARSVSPRRPQSNGGALQDLSQEEVSRVKNAFIGEFDDADGADSEYDNSENLPPIVNQKSSESVGGDKANAAPKGSKKWLQLRCQHLQNTVGTLKQEVAMRDTQRVSEVENLKKRMRAYRNEIEEKDRQLQIFKSMAVSTNSEALSKNPSKVSRVVRKW